MLLVLVLWRLLLLKLGDVRWCVTDVFDGMDDCVGRCKRCGVVACMKVPVTGEVLCKSCYSEKRGLWNGTNEWVYHGDGHGAVEISALEAAFEQARG